MTVVQVLVRGHAKRFMTNTGKLWRKYIDLRWEYRREVLTVRTDRAQYVPCKKDQRATFSHNTVKNMTEYEARNSEIRFDSSNLIGGFELLAL